MHLYIFKYPPPQIVKFHAFGLRFKYISHLPNENINKMQIHGLRTKNRLIYNLNKDSHHTPHTLFHLTKKRDTLMNMYEILVLRPEKV